MISMGPRYTTYSHAGVGAFRRRLIRRVAGGRLERAGEPYLSGPDCRRVRGIAQRISDRQRRHSRRTSRMWLDPAFARFSDLPSNIRRMMARYTPRMPFAITATELPRMKPRIFRDSEITWRHLAASCALPFALPQVRIGTHWYSDGGLLGALPLWAAAELGATQHHRSAGACRSRHPGGSGRRRALFAR